MHTVIYIICKDNDNETVITKNIYMDELLESFEMKVHFVSLLYKH